MIKLGKDLKPGDVVIKPYPGIVTEVERGKLEGSTWDGPSWTFYDLNDSYYGPGSMSLDLKEEFEIETDRKEIVRKFRIVSNALASYIADTLQELQDFDYLFNTVLRKLK